MPGGPVDSSGLHLLYAALYLSIGMVITIPPMTSLRLKSRLGLFG
jgi:hypothetical protein